LGGTLASHDDATAEQVAQSHAHGVTIAEFPTTLAAANACHALGIAVIMGAPNLVRGGSHSGNVAALDLAGCDRSDILSSECIPAGLLMAAVQLGELWGSMARGLATVTRNPARAVGLDDRGTLVPGQRAGLIRFGMVAQTPDIRRVWSVEKVVS